MEIIAICEIEPFFIQQAKELTQALPKLPIFYTNPTDWLQVCDMPEIDLVYISTPWDLHTEMAIYAMQKGKNVAIEVPLAMTIEDCWQIIHTAESTQRHCMMLENACYDTFELAILNAVQNDLFGEIIHAEGAYIHDLRKLNFQQNERDVFRGEWRIAYSRHFNGNPYPTHGIAPIAQAMNLLRGDTLTHLVSMSSAPIQMKAFAKATFGENAPQSQENYKMGDMNSTLLRTHSGKTLLLQHDISSPRPYTRHYLLSGTKGFVQKYPMHQMSFDPDGLTPISSQEIEDICRKFLPEWEKETLSLQRMLPEQKPMDIRMDYRLIKCLQEGKMLDQNIYDGALWSCLVELTQKSVENGSIPVEIPDFTKGEWKEKRILPQFLT